MARPVLIDPHARKRLIEVALPLFAQLGYTGASTRHIAYEARVNLALIRHYFGNKRGLYDETIGEVYRRLFDRRQELIGEPPPVTVEQLMPKLYAIARAEREGVRLLVREVLDHGRLRPFTEAKHFLPEIDRATDVAARLLAISPAQARTATVAIGYMLSRFVVQDDKSLVAAFGVRSAKEAHARAIHTLIVTAKALFATPLAKE